MKQVARVVCLMFVAAASPVHADKVDDFVRSQMEKQHIPGLALAVLKAGKTLKVAGYGVANIELDVPTKPETVFRIGSMSKQIIAAAVMLLVQDGKLALEDKAVKYLEAGPDAWNDITLRQLLSHTSGLQREGPAYAALKVQSDADVIKSAYSAPLLFKPGERWQYSNLGYFVLAEVISKASGRPWTDFVDQRIFQPLGMTASGPVSVDPIVPNRADGYVYDKERYRNAATLLGLRPSGAFMSSVRDMVKWDSALDRGQLLSPSTLATMQTAASLIDGSATSYGFGWEVDRLGSRQAISHGGTINGFRSHYLRLPDDKLTVIVLTNNERASSGAMASRIAAYYVDDLFPKRRAIAMPRASLDAFAGRYDLRRGGALSVTRSGKGLHAHAPAAGIDVQLLPTSATTFYSDDNLQLTFEFRKEPDERVTSVAMLIDDVETNGGARDE